MSSFFASLSNISVIYDIKKFFKTVLTDTEDISSIISCFTSASSVFVNDSFTSSRRLAILPSIMSDYFASSLS